MHFMAFCCHAAYIFVLRDEKVGLQHPFGGLRVGYAMLAVKAIEEILLGQIMS